MPVRTVNRQCSSGLQAVADVVSAIKAGFYDIGNSNIVCLTIIGYIPPLTTLLWSKQALQLAWRQ